MVTSEPFETEVDMSLKIKGKDLYTSTGEHYARIEGWRPKSSWKAEAYKNAGYKIIFTQGGISGGYAFHKDAVRAARDYYASGIFAVAMTE